MASPPPSQKRSWRPFPSLPRGREGCARHTTMVDGGILAGVRVEAGFGTAGGRTLAWRPPSTQPRPEPRAGTAAPAAHPRSWRRLAWARSAALARPQLVEHAHQLLRGCQAQLHTQHLFQGLDILARTLAASPAGSAGRSPQALSLET